MAGLLCEQLYTVKKIIRIYMIAIVFFMICGILDKNPTFGCVFSQFFSAMLILTGFAYNEKSNWDSYVNTLPVSRKQVVGSYYLLGFIFSGAALLLGAVSYGVYAVINNNIVWGDMITTLLGAFAFACVFIWCAIPIILKVGSERARIIIFLIYIALFALMSLGTTLVEEGNLEWVRELLGLLKLGSPLLLLAGLFISYLISCRIYRKKDF